MTCDLNLFEMSDSDMFYFILPYKRTNEIDLLEQ